MKRFGRRAIFVAGLAPLLFLLPAAGDAGKGSEASAWQRESRQEEVRLEGEYGLWVRQDGDRMQVSWIGRAAGAGYLRVLTDDRVREEFATPPGSVHTVAFRPPRGAEVVLQYGLRDDPADQHQTTLYLGGEGRRTRPVFSGVDSIFVVADVHGEYDNLIGLLTNAGVIDGEGRWSAGRSHLVMLGDYFSRGANVTRVLWFLYDLERQAERQRGRVHVLLGNHEIMSVTGDLRYLSPKEGLLAQLHGVEYSRMYDIRHSILGRWLATKPALVKVNAVLFAHGGVSTDYLPYTVPTYDDTLAAYIGEDIFYHAADSAYWADPANVAGLDQALLARRDDFFWGENSVFWHRAYAQSDTLGAALQSVLRRYGSNLLVVGHTPMERIQHRYGRALIVAHPRVAATELLLLVRAGSDHERYRYGLAGPAELLPSAAPHSRRGRPMPRSSAPSRSGAP